MVEDHTWTEHGKRVVCWLGFSLQGVYRFESLRLSDMSTACLWQSSHRSLNEPNLINVIDVMLL
jgi:hypothetical protein